MTARKRRHRRYVNNNRSYLWGSVVPKQNVSKERVHKIVRQSHDRAYRTNSQVPCAGVMYTLFLCVILILTGLALVHYIKLQSELTIHMKHISQMEKELYDRKAENEDNYSRIMNSINLEEIRKIAVEELGMKYPNESQVIFYDGRIRDYVSQTADIPQE